jgi:photosystem II stability/assembly factor-like uncharacterized protein
MKTKIIIRSLTSVLLVIFIVTNGLAQVKYTSAEDRLSSYQTRHENSKKSIAAGLEMTNIGPTIMSGRVVDIDVNESATQHYYVAYASSGLWYTENYGASFEPLFQYESVMTIGDIAVDWKNNTIWLGSGESNSSRSSYAGNGIYKSTNGGKTWQHLGLEETHHIGRVVIHPTNPDIVWVAALGHLYSANPERGVFKTIDGGKTWEKVLFINDDTGAVDIILDPINPYILYAASWERERKAWNFKGSGTGSGIYKSTDGGDSWQKINNDQNGFPSDARVGRIGLDISRQNPNKIYALLDNQNLRAAKEQEHKVTKETLRSISTEAFLKLDNKDINGYLDRRGFPRKYNAKQIKSDVKAGTIKPLDLVSYVEDANAMLFDTPVIGAEVYVSEDGGASWQKTHDDYIDGVYSSYGYYFGVIRVSPQDDDKIYILGVPFLKSTDGGKEWKSIDGDNMHSDHQALWVSSSTPGLLINGNDGGINTSFDDGETWTKQNTIPVGQFYSVNVDDAKNYNVYGGLQDNGVWTGPHTYNYSTRWQGRGSYPYKSIYGGDGMQVAIDTRDNNTVYTGLQFGNYSRINKHTGESESIKPQHELGESPLRFNWQSPIHLSVHNQDVVYFGSNKFHRSLDQGNDWELNSKDLTKGGKKGNVPYGTLTTIDESPLHFGLIYVGSDDGVVHVSSDGGNTWTNISEGLPEDQWVSRVEASNFSKKRVYVTLNGYRWDKFDAMVYRSDDNGSTWTKIGNNLPKEPINVIKEDPFNEDLLYLGTDHGLYVSLDRGESFMILDKSLPHVAVHDLVIQENARDLVIGTHGRSIYRANVKELQELNRKILTTPVHIFELSKTTFSDRWGNTRYAWYDQTKPSVIVPVYVQNEGIGKLNIYSKGGVLLYSKDQSFELGLNYLEYPLTIDAEKLSAFMKELKKAKSAEADLLNKKDDDNFYLIAGEYKVEVVISDNADSQTLLINKPRKRATR